MLLLSLFWNSPYVILIFLVVEGSPEAMEGQWKVMEGGGGSPEVAQCGRKSKEGKVFYCTVNLVVYIKPLMIQKGISFISGSS